MSSASLVSEHSHYVEAVLRHSFLGELSYLWKEYPGEEVQIFDAEVDNQGFDIVLIFRGYSRHIQLKSKAIDSTTRNLAVNEKLAQVSAGCIVFIEYDEHTLSIAGYRFFGFSSAGVSLTTFPQARHTRANTAGVKAFRRNTRTVPITAFHPRKCLADTAQLLFGPVLSTP